MHREAGDAGFGGNSGQVGHIRCVHGSPFVSVFQIVMAWLVRSVSAVSSTCGSGLRSDRDVHK
jgi:hypothetical protein